MLPPRGWVTLGQFVQPHTAPHFLICKWARIQGAIVMTGHCAYQVCVLVSGASGLTGHGFPSFSLTSMHTRPPLSHKESHEAVTPMGPGGLGSLQGPLGPII